MAIVENTTNNYFKINLGDCFVQNKMLFASITIYATEGDRAKEKTRTNQFLDFDNYSKQIMEDLEKNEVQVDLYEEFLHAVELVKSLRCWNGIDLRNQLVLSNEVKSLLTRCGYQADWISSPICITSKQLINLGLYENSSIDIENLYSRLKMKMTNNIINI